MKNTGFLERPEKDTDYIAGVDSGIEYKINVFNGDWTDYNSKPELQKQNGLETMRCATQSGYGKIEPQINLWLTTNKISKEFRDFLYDNGFIEEGKVQLSFHAMSILTETMPNGNYLEKVARMIRKYGLIPKYLLEFGAATTWEEYMDKSHITPEMLAIGKKSLEFIDIQFEWVITPNRSTGKTKKQLADIMLYHEKQAPLQIAKDGHATYFYNGETDIRHNQRDSYKPFEKTRPYDWSPPWVMKIVVTEKNEFTDEQIAVAKKRVLDIIPYAHKDIYGCKSMKFFRPDLHGEAYWINADGTFNYETAKGSGFQRDIREKRIIPISEMEWENFRPAEIK